MSTPACVVSPTTSTTEPLHLHSLQMSLSACVSLRRCRSYFIIGSGLPSYVCLLLAVLLFIGLTRGAPAEYNLLIQEAFDSHDIMSMTSYGQPSVVLKAEFNAYGYQQPLRTFKFHETPSTHVGRAIYAPSFRTIHTIAFVHDIELTRTLCETVGTQYLLA